MKSLTIVSGKLGSGKTEVAISLSFLYRDRGEVVELQDEDRAIYTKEQFRDRMEGFTGHLILVGKQAEKHAEDFLTVARKVRYITTSETLTGK